jgi:hypothetical protein
MPVEGEAPVQEQPYRELMLEQVARVVVALGLITEQELLEL